MEKLKFVLSTSILQRQMKDEVMKIFCSNPLFWLVLQNFSIVALFMALFVYV